jgi:hypothetical protein
MLTITCRSPRHLWSGGGELGPHSYEATRGEARTAGGRPNGLGFTATLVSLQEGRTMVEEPRQWVLDVAHFVVSERCRTMVGSFAACAVAQTR